MERSKNSHSSTYHQFLPRDALQSAVMLQYVVCPSVRLSVRDVQVQ